ncbi:uncharacterized protein EAF02_009522 [Botrytis sinoallii]|uniref:uncharacterized protein n=1 Tax=Botrytis sinoallii TaxID=1463999 RepID=UPI001901069C|nr:uncharacterized protein EAF02_009522 [Botrytis sinoallii]KAF7868786.1 hypothetical protein EAF02_009522 [Botrytis sinoallii]
MEQMLNQNILTVLGQENCGISGKFRGRFNLVKWKKMEPLASAEKAKIDANIYQTVYFPDTTSHRIIQAEKKTSKSKPEFEPDTASSIPNPFTSLLGRESPKTK